MSMGDGHHRKTPGLLLVTLAVLKLTFTLATNPEDFEWRTGLWGGCEHNVCGFGGTRTRSVWCSHKSGWPTLANHCQHMPSPPEDESCFKVCAENRGQVRWGPTKWSECRPGERGRPCLRLGGHQVRHVPCIYSPTSVILDDVVCEYFEAKPPHRRVCELKCQQNCVVSMFSPWSLCDGCFHLYSHRMRRILVAPFHGGLDCPPLVEYKDCPNCMDTYRFEVGEWSQCVKPFQFKNPKKKQRSHLLIGYEERNILCVNSQGKTVGHRHTWVVSPWTECEMLYQSRKRAEQCGPGIHVRVAFCIRVEDNQREVMADEWLCTEPKPELARQCHIYCTQNCTVSQWSAWTDCSADSCSSTQITSGHRSKSRQILQPQGGFGLPCPHLSVSQPCHPPPCVQWNITNVGECIALDDIIGCGKGIVKNTVICLDRDEKVVADDRCLIFTRIHKPVPNSQCYIPCPNDCIVSEWSPWSSCPSACQQTGPLNTRDRTKTIHGKAGPGGEACPSELSEMEVCPAPTDCQIYIWQTSDWGSCVVTKRSLSCGVGNRRRSVQCYRVNGGLMPDGRCSPESKPAEMQTCSVPCPQDCRLTDWSDWTPCSATCQHSSSTYNIPSQIRHRYIIQDDLRGGAECPSNLAETRPCPKLVPCVRYHWELSDWSQCVLPPHYIYCGQGLKARSVICKDEGDGVEDPDMCLRLVGPMPPVTEACEVMCDQHCKLSNWSDWGPCIDGCDGFRVRNRNLIGHSKDKPVCRDHSQYPLFQKKGCRCTDFEPVMVGGWSDCILEDIAADQDMNPTKKAEGKPKKEINDIADGSRRDDVYGGRGLTTPNSVDTNLPEPGRVGEEGSMGRARSDITSSPGPPQEDVPGRQTVTHRRQCGMGTRYRAYVCQSRAEAGVLEPSYNCSWNAYSEEVCIIPCPVDCEMTVWSPWEPCSMTCGSGVQTRFRRAVKPAQDDGRECPTLEDNVEYEKRVCQTACNVYTWRSSEWSQCFTEGSTGFSTDVLCGIGVKTRLVQCVHKDENLGWQKDSELFCKSTPRPNAREICEIPCPGECVVDDWSAWSQCEQPCSEQNNRRRTRNILRKPALQKNDCPPLAEEEPCTPGRNCFDYNWEVSEWSSCMLEDRRSGCGLGWKRRFPICRSVDGLMVDSHLCEQLYGPLLKPLVDDCNMTCDIDCAISEWSAWSQCSQNCGVGWLTRTRSVLYLPSGRGRSCPADLFQKKPCFLQACYTVVLSNWTRCQLERGACGHGVENRSVQCLTDEGVIVHVSRCAHQAADISTIQTERDCMIPCPGSCLLSDWSDWGPCHIGCHDYHIGDRQGITSRSRGVILLPVSNQPPCPSLWEYKSCTADKCFSFFWRTSAWVNEARQVWCERNDGANVTGGCDGAIKPADVLSCSPVCNTSHAFCTDTDWCDCEAPYSAVYDTVKSRVLLECVMASNKSEPSAIPTLYLPLDGATNIWMYAVLAAGSLFIIFVILALYTIWKRRRRKDSKDKKKREQTFLSASQNAPSRARSGHPSPCPVVSVELPVSKEGDDISSDDFKDIVSKSMWSEPNGDLYGSIAASIGLSPSPSATLRGPGESVEMNAIYASMTKPKSCIDTALAGETTPSYIASDFNPDNDLNNECMKLLPPSSDETCVKRVVSHEKLDSGVPNDKSVLLVKENGNLHFSNSKNMPHVVKVDIHVESDVSKTDSLSGRSTDDGEFSGRSDSLGQSEDTGRGSLPNDRGSLEALLLSLPGQSVDGDLPQTDQGRDHTVGHCGMIAEVNHSRDMEGSSKTVVASPDSTDRGIINGISGSSRRDVDNNLITGTPLSRNLGDQLKRSHTNSDQGSVGKPISSQSNRLSNGVPVVVFDHNQSDSDSDLPDSVNGSTTNLPLVNSTEDLAQIITTV